MKSAIEKDFYNENADEQKRIEIAKTAKADREQLERQLDAARKALRDVENGYRQACAVMIEDVFQALAEPQKEAVRGEFQCSLESRIYVDSFKKGGWKDRLNASDIRAFWQARGIDFPSPAAWAGQNGSLDPQVIKSQIEEIEDRLKV